jgi:2,4-dienoyl-CoA reductase-like NADH-dependent reductase (Old Yellow Enzyme family)
MTRRDPLLQPFQLKHLELKNRVMSSSHEPLYSVDGLPKERYRLYHEEKAKGGIALTMIGGSSVVDVDSADAFGNLHAWDEAIIPWFQELSDACARSPISVGAPIGIRIPGCRSSPPRRCASRPTAPFPRRWKTMTSAGW